ncbi:MAG: lysostaphin resistance A-like protein [Propionibacteriaceae bacterium]
MIRPPYRPDDLLATTPREPRECRYDQLLNTGQPGWLRALLVAVGGFLGFAIFTPLIAQAAMAIAWLCGGRQGTLRQYSADVAAFTHPAGMFAAHLGLAVLIIIVLVVLRWAGGLRPQWVCSVQPGMRWRFLLIVSAVAIAIMGVANLLTQDIHRIAPGQAWGWFLAIIVITSPLQAAAEEFLFRGLLLPVIGAFTQRWWPPVLISAVAFAAAHGVQNPALFLDRFAFGVLAGVLVVITGGLEAAIALHIANNVVAFIWALLFTSVAQARATTALSWSACGRDIVVYLVAALVAWGIARLYELPSRSPKAMEHINSI